MNAKWFLPVLGMVFVVGCDVGNVEKFKYTPPDMPMPKPFEGKMGKDLEDSLKKLGEMLACKESKAVAIKLSGNLDPDRVKDLTGGKVERGEARGSSFKQDEKKKEQLIHNGCPAELVKAEAGDLEVVLLSSFAASAKKVLLCGNKTANSGFLTINAGELVLSDFDYEAFGTGGVLINAGLLVLEGSNRIRATSIPSMIFRSDVAHFSINVQTGVMGLGTLELDSKVYTCAEAKEKSKETDERKEKERLEREKLKKDF